MTHHEQRLEHDLTAIRTGISEVSAEVQTAVQNSVHALLTHDRALAAETILRDLDINRRTREIDRLCHAFVARHFPSAGVLRFISSVLRLDVALERIGDYAVTICRQTVQLSGPPPESVAGDVEIMAEQSRNLLAQAVEAFEEGNADRARATMGMAKHMVNLFEKVFDDLVKEAEKGDRPARDLFELMLVFIRLERIRAQAKNICEETVFTVAGDTKEPKTYRILFVDAKNDARSRVAEGFARKAFPESGTYESAGWDPSDQLNPRTATFLDERGLAGDSAQTRRLSDLHEELAEFHVIVDLDGGAAEHLGGIPYHTTLVEWAGEPITDPTPESLEAAFEQLKPLVRDLMQKLRGEGAS